MKRRTRIQYTDSHKALMWVRWRQGESLHLPGEPCRPSGLGPGTPPQGS